MAESKYVEKKTSRGRTEQERALALRPDSDRPDFAADEQWVRQVRGDLQKIVPFLRRKCGIEFRGRVLEIGAGGAWFSAELSKLPNVVEIVATDISPRLLREQAPRVLELLGAHQAKITRMTGDCHKLDFPDNHFDYVVCATVLHHAANIVQVLREAKRVLKPGGQFVAIREPVWPLVKIKSRAKMLARLLATGVKERFYTLSEYKEFFKQAALPVEVKRVNLSRGWKYYVDKMVNGLTHARYAFVGTKRGKTEAGGGPLRNPARRTAGAGAAPRASRT
jgi:ubiquinone/menaquinone biosynthesis C-methylase UbiE